MAGPHTAQAIYSKSDTEKIIIDTIPRVAEITIDGQIYLPDELPASFDWSTDSDHIISIPKIVAEGPTTRFVFDSWKDQDSSVLRTVKVTDQKAHFIALYKTQHYLKPITEYGDVIGAGWIDEGSTAKFELESEYVLDKQNENIRYVFDSWNQGDYLNKATNSIDITQPTTVQATWDVEYKLQIETNIPDYNLFGSGWYIKGKQIALIAQENLESPSADIKYVFEKWISKGSNPVIIPNAQSPTTTITVEEPYVIEAKYKKSYQINAWTPYGSATGAGFYDEGTVTEIAVTSTAIVVDPNKVRKVFTGWDSHGAKVMNLNNADDVELENAGLVPGGQNLLLFVSGPTNVTANWKTQYYLDVQSSEAQTTGSGWYDVGRMAQIAVKAPSIPPGLWSSQVFDKWSGDIEGQTINERVIMNKPKTVVAEWREDSSPGIINGIILAAVGIVGAVIYTKTHKMNFIKNARKELSEQKPFDSFFNLRKQRPQYDPTPSFVAKQGKAKSIVDWLLGR
jgi:hypothetical protein